MLNGHKFGFVNQLLKWVDTKGQDRDNYHFLVNLPVDQFHTFKSDNIFLQNPPDGDERTWADLSPISKYKQQWKLINKAAHAIHIDRVILMEYDIYQAEIGRKVPSPFEIHGIWFRPFIRQKNLENTRSARVNFAVNLFKKKRLFDWSMRNKSVKKVFVLNDKYTVDVLNKKFKNRLAYLPDPVFDFAADDQISIRSKYQIQDKQFIVLLFGCIDARKNAINTLEALTRLHPNSQLKITLLIVGKIMEDYKSQLEEKLNEIEGKKHFEIKINDEFVSDEEMDALFSQTDLVLRMNINFFASSGIIGMSAKYNKPSIVSDYGIVADITEEYKLGKLVDPMDPDQIAEAINYYLNNKTNPEMKGMAYYESHNVGAYAKALLSI